MSSTLASRYAEILKRVHGAAVRVGRSDVTLIAVSKRQPIEAIQELYNLGQRDFGENYVQELVEKAALLKARGCTGIRWHYIGHLQTNKIKLLLPHVYAIHTVDSARVAVEVSKRAVLSNIKVPVFIEVNIDGETSKSGVSPEELSELTRIVRQEPGLTLRGLMCIPSPEKNLQGASFVKLQSLAYRVAGDQQLELSMGMSDDFEFAIAHGATHIRLGTVIFGPRKAD